MLQRIVLNPRFSLADLLLVALGGGIWVIIPKFGIWFTLIALLPWGLRLLAKEPPFQRTPFDWLMAIFLITAWVGYLASYNREAAWSKVWFIVLAVLLYYALAAQPKENLDWVCAILFCIGFGTAVYFFLTQDFVAFPRKLEVANRIGRWVMEVFPRAGWTPIHPNYVAGIAAITTPFIFYPAGKLIKRKNLFSIFLGVPIIVGSGTALFAILMATSRGIMMAIACALGSWIIWRIVELNGGRFGFRREAVFSFLILTFLCAVVLFLYTGPANGGSVVSDHYYGTGNRGELASRSVYILSDFPFTGGGLGAFPGLYSFYMLGIPSFYVPNSHNLFLDIAIEQGLLGGISVLIINVMSIWFMARAIAKTDSLQVRMFGWLTLFGLVIAFVHGMVDNYLYNGPGTLLLLSLAGLSTVVRPSREHLGRPANQLVPSFIMLALVGVFMLNLNSIRSAWYANLGAVQMAKVELAGFPTGRWTDSSIVPELAQAKASLRSAIQANPKNRTANHRLGLIALLQQDFYSAAAYLEKANQEAPNHRGIIKSLGYCYVWLGNMEKASLFLRNIPEARAELDVYVWWWDAQGRPELAEKASLYLASVEPMTTQE